MSRRNRQRTKLAAPATVYTDQDGNELELRGSLTPATRRAYADQLAGGLNRDDARERSIELLFEQLTVSWTIAGLKIKRQNELLGRYRMATAGEREFVLNSLRAHAADNFPELEAP